MTAIYTAVVVPFIAGLVAFQGALAVSDGMQVSARPAFTGQSTPVDLDNTPAAGVSVGGSAGQAALGYAPQLSLRGALEPSTRSTLVMHNGYLRLSTGSKGHHLSLSQTASFGTMTFSRLVLNTTDPMATPNPTSSRIDFIPPTTETVTTSSLHTSASYEEQWNTRWRSSLYASYGITGGRGAAAQTAIPRQKTAGAGLSTGHTLTRIDRLSGSLHGTNTRTSNQYDHWTLTLDGSWGHELSAKSAFQVSLGLATLYTYTPTNDLTIIVITPVGSGSYSTQLMQARGLTMSLNLGLSMAPAVNYLNSRLEQRIQGAATVSATILERTSVSASGDGAQVLSFHDDGSARIIGFGVTASHRPGKMVSLLAGYRTAWQVSSESFIGSLGRQWTAYLGVNFALEPLTF